MTSPEEHPTDVVARATAALDGITDGPWGHCVVGPEDEDHADYMAGTLSRSGEPLHVLIADSPVAEYAYIVPAITGDGPRSARNAEFIAASRSLVPELVAEVERLRAGGAWTEHVERQRAMKRERDGDCICNYNDGPDEFCPWHGRSYNELVDIIVRQQAELNL